MNRGDRTTSTRIRIGSILTVAVVAMTVAAGALAVVVVGPASAQTEPTPISSCTTITSPGEYVLTGDVTNSDATPCIEIDGVPGTVTLDGDGHTITGGGSGTGIAVPVTDDATITNVVVDDWTTGIAYLASDGRVHDSVVRDTDSGISAGAFASLDASDNRLENNGVGLVFDIDSGGTATNNTVTANGIGISVASPVETLRNNTVRANSRDGIVLTGALDASVAQGVGVVENTISDNGDDGIELDTAFDNELTRNTITGNGAGIELNGTTNANVISDNRLENEDNVVFGSTFGDPVAGSDYGTENRWNVSKRPGENVVGGPFVGGNYYAHLDGTGFSQTCTDADGDGICDDPNRLGAPNNTDFLPLTTSETPERNTLRVVGHGSYSTYRFEAGGTIDEGASSGLDGEDSVASDGKSAAGAVKGGSDVFAFDGELGAIRVGGTATLFLNGEAIEATTRARTLEVDGQGNYSTYQIEVNGTIDEETSALLDREDTIASEGRGASGAVRAGPDVYVFEGELEDLAIDGDAIAYLDGEETSSTGAQ